MASHKIVIEFNEETGELSVEHRTSTKIGEHTVTHSENVDLTDKSAIKKNLIELIDHNRESMEEVTQSRAIQHVAAFTKQNVPEKGVKKVSMGGVLGASGKARPDTIKKTKKKG